MHVPRPRTFFVITALLVVSILATPATATRIVTVAQEEPGGWLARSWKSPALDAASAARTTTTSAAMAAASGRTDPAAVRSGSELVRTHTVLTVGNTPTNITATTP